MSLNITGRSRSAIAINRQVPGPVLKFREGEEVIINVANRLREETSIHWHGLILPSGQDDFRQTYNSTWLNERHGFRTPDAVRQDQLSPAALAA